MKPRSSASNMTMKHRSESVRVQNTSRIKENKERGHVKAETSEGEGQEETHFMN